MAGRRDDFRATVPRLPLLALWLRHLLVTDADRLPMGVDARRVDRRIAQRRRSSPANRNAIRQR